jgi:hypothetical protein
MYWKYKPRKIISSNIGNLGKKLIIFEIFLYAQITTREVSFGPQLSVPLYL